MNRRQFAAAPLLTAALVVSLTLPGSAQAPSSSRRILGDWHGESICVKEASNASCHDEEIVYRFIPDSGNGIVLHAFKIVAGVEDSMGALPVRFDAAHDTWLANFSNTRVSIEWSCRITGDSLTGEIVMLPDRRRVRAFRTTRVPAR